MAAAGASTARANVNIALVKYWGKRDPALNLPATGSISLTLDGLAVEARVAFGGATRDRFAIAGARRRADAARPLHRRGARRGRPARERRRVDDEHRSARHRPRVLGGGVRR